MRPGSLKLDSRIRAISVPKMRPPSAAKPVRVSVNVMPSRNKYGSERRMTSKSRLPSMGALFPRDVAGDRQPALEQAHAGDDDEVDQKIQHGRGGEGLEHLEREFLHRARLAGQFDQTDSDRDRRVFDGIEKFGSERRHDD